MAGRYVCVATRMRVRGPLQLLPFLWASVRATVAAWRTPGVKRVKLIGMPPFPVFWTLSVWDSEADMSTFVRSAGHRFAMAGFEKWAANGCFVRFTSDRRGVSWRRAFAELRDPDGTYRRGAGYTRKAQAQPPAPIAPAEA